MQSPENECPDEARLDAFVRGQLAGSALASVEAHLAGCATCRQIVALAAGASASAAPEPALTRGVSFGRYLVLETLGAGAMGTVYLAYDPDLDRKIALKVLRSEPSADAPESVRREQLLREAKALARVKHPNVVAVFDAGMHEDRVFIAMELVEGTSLGRWLREAPSGARAVREIIESFVAAGRGLAAAHAVGLVHRDFKPDNVLVGRDGHVCVTDFGLARAEVRPTSRPGADGGERMTRTGTIAGTPAYMAPEQLRGERADARSDQFAFCVALCEGLSGRRPFSGDTLEELSRTMARGDPKLPQAAPARVRRALARGLAIDPGERFPSMDALLTALSGQGRRRALTAAAAVAVLAAAVGTTMAVGAASDAAPACGELAAAEAAQLWSPRREAIRAAFDASGSPLAAGAFAGVERVVTAYLDAYRDSQIQTCEARALPDDPRVSCLGERRRELEALFDVLAHADATVVREAVLAAHAMRPVQLCGDLSSARSAAALAPGSPEATAVAEELARAGALRDAGKFDDGLAVVQRAGERAKALDDERFEHRARLLEGELEINLGRFDDAEKGLEDLYFAAVGQHDDEAAARALIEIVRVHAEYLRVPDKALAWSRHAEAAIRRLGEVPLLDADLHYQRGIIAGNQSRFDEALDHFQRALAIHERILGPDSMQIPGDLAGMGNILTMAGRFDEALGHQKRALAATEAALGPDHPRVANRLLNVAITLGRSNKGYEGLPYLERALKIARATLGPEHPTTLMAVGVLGAVYLEIEDPAKSLEVLAEGVKAIVARDLWNPNLDHLFLNLAIAALMEHRFDEAAQALVWVKKCSPEGTTSPLADATAVSTQGSLELERGDLEAALASFDKARALRQSAAPNDDLESAQSAFDHGQVYAALGRLDEAMKEITSARTLFEKVYGADSGWVASALVELGDVELRRGGPAAPLYEQALTIAERAKRIESLGRAAFGLAQALATTAPERARSLAEKARDVFAQRDYLGRRKAKVEEWLAASGTAH